MNKYTETVDDLIYKNYRHNPAYGEIVAAQSTPQHPVGVEDGSHTIYPNKRGPYRHFPAVEINIIIRHQSRWLVTVGEGWESPDNLVTIAGWRTPDPAIIRAVWLEQGRGHSLIPRHGWICRSNCGNFYYHSQDSASRAKKGLARKTKIAQKQQAIDSPAVFDSIFLPVALTSGKKITTADAVAVGACVTGIRSYKSRTGITVNAMPVSQFCKIEQKYRRAEARAAIIRALNRR